MSRPAWAEIDLAALRHNLNIVRRAAPSSHIVAVIKANAYGHGIVRTAKALSDTDAFGVASIDEAVQLREAGISQRIVLLEGVFAPDELELVVKYNLDLVVHNHAQVEMLEQGPASNSTISIWLKLDTGMHRLGFSVDTLPGIVERLQNISNTTIPVILMTHLANADDLQDKLTSIQLECFNAAVKKLGQQQKLETSIANSAGILAWPASHTDWVRPGIMLYGISPIHGKTAKDFDLQTVMSVKSKLIDIQSLKKGDAVGYGGTWVCPEDMRVGVVAFGYGDGYPRHAKNGTPLLINNKRASLIGRVSMDMITVDLRDHDDAKAGDEVELWGKSLAVEEVARSADTIAYELVCGITQRVKYIEI